MQSKHQCITASILHILYSTKMSLQKLTKRNKYSLTRKKTLDEGAFVFGKTMKRIKHAAGSLMTVVALVRRNYAKNLSKKTSDPIQSNPIQSMSNSAFTIRKRNKSITEWKFRPVAIFSSGKARIHYTGFPEANP